MPQKAVIRKRQLVVHLGNVGDIKKQGQKLQKGSKTRKYAKRFPDIDFVGIDLEKYKPRMKNWQQIRAEFVEGLNKLEDNSVSLISSELAVGHYWSMSAESMQYIHYPKQHTEYLEEILSTAYRKLKKGGKLMLVVEKDIANIIWNKLGELQFSKEIKRKLTPKEHERTTWTKWSHHKQALYQIIAEK